MSDTLDSIPLLTVSETKEALGPPEKPGNEDDQLRFQDIGVWTIMRDVKSSWDVPEVSKWKLDADIQGVISLVWRFVVECVTVGPWLVFIYCLTMIWSGTEVAVGLYFSSRILDIIQNIIVDHQVDARSLVFAVLLNVAFTLVNCVISRIGQDARSTLATRIRYLFSARLIQASLRLDFPTFEEPERASKITKLFGYGTHGGAWEIFEDLVYRFQGVASICSQAGFLVGVLSSHPGGGWFAALCVGKATFDRVTSRSLWSHISYVWDSNPHYRRMNSLLTLVTSTSHRVEVISNGISDFIQREWAISRRLLGDTSDDYPDSLLYSQKPLGLIFLDAISGDFPLIFYAYQVLMSPTSFSLTSVALMQQASTSLSYTITNLMSSQHSLQQRINDIRSLYESSHIPNKLLDEGVKYPLKSAEPTAGMEISFQNVSFAYPNSTKNVIEDVSFTIGRGQTVMIVGVNGSGKSTLLKLFNRLYDPISGNIKVDGSPMTAFDSADLRRASAMLFQSFSHFSLSIRENITLGLPDLDLRSFEDEKGSKPALDGLVDNAARLGGSLDFVKEQSNGFDTVLHPAVNGYNTSFRQGSDAFKKKVKEINKKVDVSSGQWQRLALSRLFFRAAGDEVKLVAVDEPSASLDPKMEYDLFESLRNLSTAKGKTLVFVTHRFGYLTKRADLILVMQNGRLVEQGKHNDLLKMGGEYAKLYNLQAEAFLPSEDSK